MKREYQVKVAHQCKKKKKLYWIFGSKELNNALLYFIHASIRFYKTFAYFF